MNHRIRNTLAAALLMFGGTAAAQQAPAPQGEGEQPIEPVVARSGVEVPRIHARDVEFGFFAGSLTIDGFGSELIYGLRLGYHLSEDFFLEASYGRSTISDERFRLYGDPKFAAEDEDLDSYHLSLGYNVLPGEVFLGEGRAFTSGLFLTTGLGNIHFANEDFFTYHLGLGVRVLPTDSITLRVDFRQYIFEMDLFGDPEMSYSPELTAGLSIYF